jgi:hypothetical protein
MCVWQLSGAQFTIIHFNPFSFCFGKIFSLEQLKDENVDDGDDDDDGGG